MLDFSASQIGLVGVVALIAIGPERIPKEARAAGILVGRFRRYARSVKEELDREMEKTELLELKKRMDEAAKEAERQMAASGKSTQSFLQAPVMEIRDGQVIVTPAGSPSGDSLGSADAGTAEVAVVSAAHPVPATLGGDPFAEHPEPAHGVKLVVEPSFGGDPFSARPSAPLRSKPVTPRQPVAPASTGVEST